MTARAGSIVVLNVGAFVATVTIPPITPATVSTMPVEWSPRVPDFDRDLTTDQLADYRRRVAEAVAPREVIRDE